MGKGTNGIDQKDTLCLRVNSPNWERVSNRDVSRPDYQCKPLIDSYSQSKLGNYHQKRDRKLAKYNKYQVIISLAV